VTGLVHGCRSVESGQYIIDILFVLLCDARRRDSELRCASSTSKSIPHLRLLHLLLPLLLDQLFLSLLDRHVASSLLRR
jgi:hypothetical protein